MLSAEEASARLASLRDPQWRAKAASRVRKLRRKLITSRTRSSLVNATSAIAATSIPWAGSSAVCARRQVTTGPLPRAHDPHQPPPLVIIDLTHPQASGHRPGPGDQHPLKLPGRAKRDLYSASGRAADRRRTRASRRGGGPG